MDERTDVSAAYALRLTADILTTLVLRGVLSKADATALVDGSLASMLESHPEHEPNVRKIAGALTAQVELSVLDLERQLRKPPKS